MVEDEVITPFVELAKLVDLSRLIYGVQTTAVIILFCNSLKNISFTLKEFEKLPR